jgi:drug/metabolite transporter (DMT)-like permease
MSRNPPSSTVRSGYGSAAAVVLLWAGFVIVGRIGGKSALSGYDVTAIRFATASIVLAPVALRMRRAELLSVRMLALALTGGLFYSLLVYWGFKHAPATHAAILLPGLLPLNAALIAWLLTGEAIPRGRWLGLAGILAGLVLMGLHNHMSGVGRDVLLGDVLLAGSSVMYALYSVLARKWRIGPLPAATGLSLGTAAIYLPIYVVFLPHRIGAASATDIGMQALYQGVLASVIAALLYLRAMQSLGPSRVGAMMGFTPVVSSILAVVLLSEPMTGYLALGLVLVCGGAITCARPVATAPSAPPTEEERAGWPTTRSRPLAPRS